VQFMFWEKKNSTCGGRQPPQLFLEGEKPPEHGAWLLQAFNLTWGADTVCASEGDFLMRDPGLEPGLDAPASSTGGEATTLIMHSLSLGRTQKYLSLVGSVNLCELILGPKEH
jgi:hypothetical protein